DGQGRADDHGRGVVRDETEAEAEVGDLEFQAVRQSGRLGDQVGADPGAVKGLVVAEQPLAVFEIDAGVLTGGALVAEDDLTLSAAADHGRSFGVEGANAGSTLPAHDGQQCAHSAPGYFCRRVPGRRATSGGRRAKGRGERPNYATRNDGDVQRVAW